MPHFFRKISDRVRSFGFAAKTINESDKENTKNGQDNYAYTGKTTKRKRSSIIKTVTNSLKKQRRGSDAVLGGAGGLSSSVVFSPPHSDACYTTPLRGKGDGSYLNASPKKHVCNIASCTEANISNLKRINRCENIADLSPKHRFFKSPSLDFNNAWNLAKPNHSMTNLVNKTEGKISEECERPKAARTLSNFATLGKQDVTKSKEKLDIFILPPVRQFRPVKLNKGRIIRDNGSPIRDKSKGGGTKSGKTSNLLRPHNSDITIQRAILSDTSSVTKIGNIRDSICTSLRSESVISHLCEANKKQRNIQKGDSGSGAVGTGIENEQIHTNFLQGKENIVFSVKDLGEEQSFATTPFKTMKMSTCFEGTETIDKEEIVGVNKLNYKMEDVAANQVLVDEPLHLGFLACSKCKSYNSITCHGRTDNLGRSAKKQSNTTDEVQHSPGGLTVGSSLPVSPHICKSNESELEDQTKRCSEDRAYKEKFPFLSPKQVEYIFAKDKDGIPLCRSQSAHDLTDDFSCSKEGLQSNRRNSLSEVDKFNRYIEFLESRQSPNKTTGEFYINEVMTGLKTSKPRLTSWQSTPNSNWLDSYGQCTANHSTGDRPLLAVDLLKVGGILGKQTSELYPKPFENTPYFAALY